MKKCLRFILSSVIILLAFCGLIKSTPQTVIAADSVDSYYSGINANSTSLLSDLQRLNSSKRKFTPGYDGFKTYYKQTDVDPTNPNNLIVFYTGESIPFNGNFGGTINREHVWPNSRGGKAVEGDIHMTRPTSSANNSERGNSFYVEGKNSSTSGWDPKLTKGGLEKYRGISARIIFYCVVAESKLKLVDLENDSTGNNSMGKLSDLLKWNLAYGIDETEVRRNEAAEEIQGNRNPFIDHPEYACKIWGNTNATTKSICGDVGGQEDPTKTDKEAVEADTSELQQTYTETFKNPITTISSLKIKGTNGSDISWVSSNTDAFKIVNSSNVTIKQSDKNVTLKLTATVSKGNESKTVEFNVTIKHNVIEPQLKPILKENQEIADTNETIYEYKFTKAEGLSIGDNTFGGIKWNFDNAIAGEHMEWDSSGSNYGFQLGSKSKPAGGTFVTSDLSSKSVKSIGITAKTGNSGRATVNIYIGNQMIYTQAISSESTYCEAINTGKLTGDIKIELVAGDRAMYVNSFKIVYSDSGFVDANETTYASISLQNPNIRFGITLSKKAILKTLNVETIDLNDVELGVYVTDTNTLSEYGYENLKILYASNYKTRMQTQPLFTYNETSDSCSVSLVLYNVNKDNTYYAMCYLKYNDQYYFANEIATSYLEIAANNLEKLTSLKQDLVTKNQYNNEYEKQLELLNGILA